MPALAERETAAIAAVEHNNTARFFMNRFLHILGTPTAQNGGLNRLRSSPGEQRNS
jgi:hypothetical protein